MSCNSKKAEVLSRSGANTWHVIQFGQYRSDSSTTFFRFKKNGTYEELILAAGNFKSINSNPDIKGFHKWEIINDSVVNLSYLPYRIILLNDSAVTLLNIKRPQDTLVMINHRL
jgi:hypothetical protein